jgi:hypothetical protein
MAQRTPLTFTAEDLQALACERSRRVTDRRLPDEARGR